MRRWYFCLSLVVTVLGCSSELGSFSEDSLEVPHDTHMSASNTADAPQDTGMYDDSSTASSDTNIPDGNGNPFASCEESLGQPIAWFDGLPAGQLVGDLEFGQTHIMGVNDARIGPDVAAGRDTMLLFSPSSALSSKADVRVAAFESGVLKGVLQMQPPAALPTPLESDLTTSELEPFSIDAWSASLPWQWIRNGISLRIGVSEQSEWRVLNYELQALAAPHEFTLTRTHMVLFGADDYEVIPPHPVPKVARDMAAWVPGAALRWVDTSAWRLDRIVVNTADGPRWATSEEARLAITTDETRWNLIKHQGALRLSLANTGRGLRYTLPPEGDNSPFSYGTSMVQGWVRLESGQYTDINNAGLAAGWTGWSGMWLDECGNGFIHEVGHTFSLLHFTEGTAATWGIEDEYPSDGIWLASHPWGYDTIRRRFRTWYRVDTEGPVLNNGALVGKRDPMNGGEPSNRETCFPSYTAYQTKRSLDWMENNSTLRSIDGVPGAYRWDRSSGQYILEAEPPDVQSIRAVGVPVLTLIGTLGNVDTVCQTYPPITVPHGNAFDLPDPLAPDHIGFSGAQWFIAITYADGSIDRGLINRSGVAETDTSLYLYSVNVALDRAPQKVELFRSKSGYPSIDIESADLVHTRVLTSPDFPEGEVLRVGWGELANGEIRLMERCEDGINCESRRAESVFSVSDGQVSFKPQGANLPDTTCGAEGEADLWTIPIVSDGGEEGTVIVRAMRRLMTEASRIDVPASDRTPWIHASNLRQALVLHLPYAENSNLSAGTWRTPEQFMVSVYRDGTYWRSIPLSIDLSVNVAQTVTIPPDFVSQGVSIAADASDSSIYFTFDDPSIGPSTAKWWGDDSGNLIYVPVRDVETGESTTLTLRGHKLACNSQWEINTGQSADWGCTHQIRLRWEPGANESLISGHSYVSPLSAPVIIRGRRWHQPDAGGILQTLALSFSHTVP